LIQFYGHLNTDTQSVIADLQAAARTLGLQLVVINASTDSDLETAFATFSQQRIGAVLVTQSNFYTRRMEPLAALAARHALPAIYPYREEVLAGGLLSYGSMAAAAAILSTKLASILGASSKARNQPICRCSRSPSSN
jgi:putative ABC transport system substrate-binding protein